LIVWAVLVKERLPGATHNSWRFKSLIVSVKQGGYMKRTSIGKNRSTVVYRSLLNREIFHAGVMLFSLVTSALMVPGIVLSQDISAEYKVEHRIINIQERQGLVPNTVIIKRGTTVIWLNYSRDPMEIKFQNQKVTTACREPINFFIADNGSYQSKPLATGAVASLCFLEKGEFEYQLQKRTTDWRIDPKLLRGLVKVY
jgi:hypothetical protein